MKKLVFILIFNFNSHLQAQITDPDTTRKNYPPSQKVNLDTVRSAIPDTVFKDSIVNHSMKKSNFRSPGGALLRSLALPGWGQLYNKKYFKAVIIAGGEGVLLGTALVEWKRAADAKKDLSQPASIRLEDYRLHVNNRNLFLWLYAAATVFSMLDAYVDAHLSQDTGEGVPKIGHLILEPDTGQKALLLKLKIDF